MHLKMSSAKWRPFCPGGDELMGEIRRWDVSGDHHSPGGIMNAQTIWLILYHPLIAILRSHQHAYGSSTENIFVMFMWWEYTNKTTHFSFLIDRFPKENDRKVKDSITAKLLILSRSMQKVLCHMYKHSCYFSQMIHRTRGPMCMYKASDLSKYENGLFVFSEKHKCPEHRSTNQTKVIQNALLCTAPRVRI